MDKDGSRPHENSQKAATGEAAELSVTSAIEGPVGSVGLVAAGGTASEWLRVRGRLGRPDLGWRLHSEAKP